MVWPYDARISWGTFLKRLAEDGVTIHQGTLDIEVDGQHFKGDSMRRTIPGGKTLEIPHPYNYVQHPPLVSQVDAAALQLVIHGLDLDPDRYELLP